ncbi:ATP synthase F0 subunit B [Desulfuromonas thiophila]|uniref:ATP synthase subunit b n=1 Tax=Desulfuromonas thiophila TaxID=57664 RepID=A0A1G7CMF8_9BACT|nr:ATP synthase F0 subunit B [Desulfuromonas thiophila]MCK9172141.1 ATP synthase F0 subunit B [Desulfuromonas thiophila]MDD3801816.1 ATP synthase F0 subunit B [Desulfuromonas thiophila]MDY0397899.1 ATP synthase F0 subunit B [Desulfuromonas thiophila]SDE39846.1 F-type H+-transporting ATPase subunit b [Desulfuromonas thiophila]
MISIDWTLLVQFVNFLVLMAVLNVLLYRPLRRVMAERQQAIDGGHQKARDLEASINEKMERYQNQLTQAKVEGSQQAAALRAEAAQEESRLLSAARDEAGQRLEQLKGAVAQEAERARKGLKKDAEGLAASIASKVLGRNVK